MSLKFTTTTWTYKCPNCHQEIKKEVKDEGLDFISILLFIPVGLIRLICNLTKKRSKPKIYNVLGEEIIKCEQCEKLIAISGSSCVGIPSARVLLTWQEICYMIKPAVRYLLDNGYNYQLAKVDEYSESICFVFSENRNKKKVIGVSHSIMGKLMINDINGHYEYTHEKFIDLVINNT